MTMNLRRVFLSHSSSNLDEVVRFDSQLRQHGVPLWRDRVDLAKGVPVESEIAQAGIDAIGFTFYLTHEAAASEWVRVQELGYAVQNARLDHSFGIVPVFRDDKNAVVEKMLELATNGDPKYDLRQNTGYIIRNPSELALEGELAQAAHTVLLSTLRTLREHSVSGSRLRLGAVTRNTKPWSSTPIDLVLDWSHLYPPVVSHLPNPGVGKTQLLVALQSLSDAITQEWADNRIQLIPHCHPSMAVCCGFLFRRGTGFDLEVLDHASGSRAIGPARPVAADRGVWQETLVESGPESRDIALVVGVSRDIVADARRTLDVLGVQVGAVLGLAPSNGPSHSALPLDEPLYQHGLAVSAVHRVTEIQSHRGVGTVHLFIAVPGTLAVLLGQQLTNIGAVQLYDFDNESKNYVPVLSLSHK